MNKSIIINKGIRLDNFADYGEAIGAFIKIWKEKGNAVVNYIYWASYPLIDTDARYAESLGLSDVLLPDGIGMYLYVKNILNIRLNNLNGTDFNPVIVDFLFKEGIEVAFYGATEESISGAVRNLEQKSRKVYYYSNGYSSLDWNKIKDNSALVVGLGTPLQEYWVTDNIDIIRQKRLLVITVGGYFDFLSGKFKRAPMIFRKLKIEWLWRAPQCDMKRNFRNLYIFHYIIKDRRKIRLLNCAT